jgi:O-antigen ligase
MVERGLTSTRQWLVALGVLLGACVIGALLPWYVQKMGDGAARLAALPVLLLLGFLLAVDRKFLLLLIILFRASADLLFENTKLSFGGVQTGVGGLVNLFVLMIAVLLVMEKPDAVPRKTILVMWAAFLLTALMGVAASPVKAEALKVFLALLSYLAIFVSAFYFVNSSRDFGACVRIVLWSSAIPVLYSFVDAAMGIQSSGIEGFRLKSTFTHPNIFACYLTLVIALVLYAMKSARMALGPAKRHWLGAYLALLLFLLVLTKTRSAWIATFVVFVLYALFFERRYLAYLMLLPVAAAILPGVGARLRDLDEHNQFAQFAALNSFEWRRLIWETGLEWMRPARYLLGYGLDAFRHYSPQFFPLAGNFNPGAHNVYVQWLFEVGVVGLCALTWLFGTLAWRIKGMLQFDRLGAFIALSLLAAYLTISFSDNMFWYLAFNWYFWFVLGAACAAVTRAGTEGREAGGARSGVQAAGAGAGA